MLSQLLSLIPLLKISYIHSQVLKSGDNALHKSDNDKCVFPTSQTIMLVLHEIQYMNNNNTYSPILSCPTTCTAAPASVVDVANVP